MRFIDTIFSLVWDISDFFYDAFLEVKGWGWPLYLLQHPLWGLQRVFWDLLTPIAELGDWADDVAAKVSNILGKTDILLLLSTWLTYAENAWSWVQIAGEIIAYYINTWWKTALATVQGLINTAAAAVSTLIDNVAQGLSSLQTTWDNFWTMTWPEWTRKLDSVTIAWNNFWTITYPTLLTKTDADALMNTKVKEAEPGWAGWSDFREKVVLFLTDPLDWIRTYVLEPIVEDFIAGFNRGIKGA